MSNFVNILDIFGRDVYVREILLSDYRVLLKSLLGDIPNPKVAFTNVHRILIEYTDLSLTEIENLDFVDLFIILINVRSISLGNTLRLNMLNENANTTITLDVDHVLNIFSNIKVDFLKESTLINEEYEMTYRLPTVIELLSFQELKSGDIDFSVFIESIAFMNKGVITIDKNISVKERSSIFSRLPAKCSLKVFKKIKELCEDMSKINVLKILNNPAISDNYVIPINIEINNLAFILKLLFSDDLMSMYHNIYELSSKISADYLDKCTVGEYGVYLKMLDNHIKEQSAAQKEQEPATIGDKIDEDALFGGDIPITNSEFTP